MAPTRPCVGLWPHTPWRGRHTGADLLIIGAAAALALGVPLGTLLVVAAAAILACPVSRYFGMCGMAMRQEAKRAPQHDQAALPDLGHPPQDSARQRVTLGQKEKLDA